MRILAIGLGGAGCRIADALYANDRKSSKVTCVQAFAVDTDNETLARLRALPEQSRIGFEPLDADLPLGSGTARQSGVDIPEILARIQNREGEDPDAILVCTGLGGSLTDAVPGLITALKGSVTVPVFGLVTLPALAEGEKRSAKAADDIEQIAPLLDGTILFDNETWLKKIAHRRDQILAEMNNDKGFLGFGKNAPKLTPQEVTDRLLNQNIIRRISLILRAGEFRADGGIDLAEVVMDSSEVLNTLKGMGFVAIGYAVEHLRHSPLAFLTKLRSTDNAEEQRKSAERIIELAKQAIYQEVSVPCDMTSAAKALILVAGPSHEISMKGFMTVRKWIDRSIAGMETRSGDYPVTNSNYVAIIVVLSGLQNVPRITELQEIRDQYRYGSVRRTPPAGFSLPPETLNEASAVLPEFYSDSGSSAARDNRIAIPRERPQKQRYEPQQVPAELPAYEEVPLRTARQSAPGGLPHAAPAPRPAQVRQNAGISERELPQPRYQDTRVTPEDGDSQGVPQRRSSHPPDIGRTKAPEEIQPPAAATRSGRISNPERIAWDLQKKREQARHTAARSENTAVKPHPPAQEVQEKKVILRKSPVKSPTHVPSALPDPEEVPEKRTVIRIRRKEPKTEEPASWDEPAEAAGPSRQEELETLPDTGTPVLLDEDAITAYKDRKAPSHDDMFLGKAITKKETLRSKDSALLHTDIGTKKTKHTPEETAMESPRAEPEPKGKKPRKPAAHRDDISWVSD
jgi:Cell division GTPase